MSAWTRNQNGKYYYHKIDSTKPDLNYRNPKVVDELIVISSFHFLYSKYQIVFFEIEFIKILARYWGRWIQFA